MTTTPLPNPNRHEARDVARKAQTIGSVAARLIARHSAAVVLAEFERCIYLRLLRDEKDPHLSAIEWTADSGFEADNALVCITDSALGAGPLQICVDDFHLRAFNARARVAVGARVEVVDDSLTILADRIGNEDVVAGLTIDCAGAAHFAEVARIDECRDARRALRRLGQSNEVAIGIAPGLRDGLVRARSAQPRRTLNGWLSAATPGGRSYRHQAPAQPVPEDVRDLLGLGPGLTPAGDDYLAGVLIGLRYCRRNEAVQELSRFLESHVRQRTNRISRAHLACVCAGWYQEIIIELLTAIDGNPQRLHSAIRKLVNFGHTSGLDLLGGLTTALDSSR